jgi:PIN domain nuclease of toxin-antitoxin system
MTGSLLLDTCAMIWLATEQTVSDQALAAIARAHEQGEAIYVSPITAWELGLLVGRGRLNLSMSPDRWFSHVLKESGALLAEMPPELLIASSFLPGKPPRDPADRILAATAREYAYTLLTRDGPLLNYAAEGHMAALTC